VLVALNEWSIIKSGGMNQSIQRCAQLSISHQLKFGMSCHPHYLSSRSSLMDLIRELMTIFSAGWLDAGRHFNCISKWQCFLCSSTKFRWFIFLLIFSTSSSWLLLICFLSSSMSSFLLRLFSVCYLTICFFASFCRSRAIALSVAAIQFIVCSLSLSFSHL